MHNGVKLLTIRSGNLAHYLVGIRQMAPPEREAHIRYTEDHTWSGTDSVSKQATPLAVKLGWQHRYISNMTYKPSKLGHTCQVFGLLTEFINSSLRVGLQVLTYSDYELCRPG